MDTTTHNNVEQKLMMTNLPLMVELAQPRLAPAVSLPDIIDFRLKPGTTNGECDTKLANGTREIDTLLTDTHDYSSHGQDDNCERLFVYGV